MSNPNPNGDDPTKNGDQTNPSGTDLKGKVDEQGVPLDAEERAEYYKKLSEENDSKFRNSSKGAQELLDQKKVLEKENERLKTNRDPSHGGEVSQKDLDDLKTRQDEVERKQAIADNKQAFASQFKALIGKEEFKNIQSQRDSFESYAYQDENLQTPIEVLARSFQVEKGLIKDQKTDENDEGRPGIEEGTGGGSNNQPSGKKGYTSAQAEKLRKEDPRKYNRLVRDGKLNITD